MFYISSMLLNLSILFKFTVFKIQIFFLISTFRSILFIFFYFTSNDKFSTANDFSNIHVVQNNIPRLDNIILFRNLFLSYTNINYSSFFCHLRNFNCQRMLFNWLDVGTSISQFNLFKHEIFIYIVFGECVTVKKTVIMILNSILNSLNVILDRHHISFLPDLN